MSPSTSAGSYCPATARRAIARKGSALGSSSSLRTAGQLSARRSAGRLRQPPDRVQPPADAGPALLQRGDDRRGPVLAAALERRLSPAALGGTLVVEPAHDLAQPGRQRALLPRGRRRLALPADV